VLGIDRNAEIVQRNADDLTETVVLDATNEDALRAAGIPEFNTVIVAIGRDFEAAALCVGTLKDLGVPNVIVQARSLRHQQLFSRIGADRVVMPLQAGGERLAEELGIPALLKRLDLSPDYTIAELATPPSLVGKRIGDLNLRETQSINILIIRRGDEINVSPPAHVTLQENDVLVVLGPTENVLALADF
jgi:trk system potassium uptake protein TrkA